MSPKGTKTGVWTGGAFAEAAATGTVVLEVTPESGTWTLTGPGTYEETGTGSETLAAVEIGEYKLVFDALANYTKPPDQHGRLTEGATLTLAAMYTSGSTAYAPGIVATTSYSHERKIRTTDSQGGFTRTWADLGTVWGRDQSATSKEVDEAAQHLGKIDTVVYVGPDEDVQREDRLTTGTRVLRVARIERPSVSVYLKCICEETERED